MGKVFREYESEARHTVPHSRGPAVVHGLSSGRRKGIPRDVSEGPPRGLQDRTNVRESAAYLKDFLYSKNHLSGITVVPPQGRSTIQRLNCSG